jgi:site-specific recombinase XerD
MKQAGVEGEGGFYQLRRAQGKNLVVSGVPVTTVSQVLGHTDISNTKQYIALDTCSLKVCALDFSGIRPRGEINELHLPKCLCRIDHWLC